MKRILTLDIGSSSLGWAVTSYQSHQESRTEQHGVVTFEAGMPKDKKGYYSPTKKRRESRNARVLSQHRRYRKQNLLRLLIREGMVPLESRHLKRWVYYKKGQPRVFPESKHFRKWLDCNFSYNDGPEYKNPYDLRVKALNEPVSDHEFGRALYHLMQRRGYKDIGGKDKETKKQEKRRSQKMVDQADQLSLKDAIAKHEYLSKAFKYEFLDKNQPEGAKTNKGLRTRNQLTYRHECEQELIALCEKQGYDTQDYDRYKSKQPSKNSFVQHLYRFIIYQLPLKSQKGNVGKCTLEPKRRRCPASHPLSEVFRAWHFINNIKYEHEGKMKTLDLDLKKQVFKQVFLKQVKNFEFKKVQTALFKIKKISSKFN